MNTFSENWLQCPRGEASQSSVAIQQHLMKIYRNPTPDELRKAKKNQTTKPVFFRKLHPEEFHDYQLESRVLLSDKTLCFISPRQSAERELPLQKHMRAPLQEAIYRVFSRHQEYPQIAWQMIHIILERVENEQLNRTFAIPKGFNGSFYVYILHLWLLHCRLMQSSKGKKSAFFENPLLALAPSAAGSNSSRSCNGNIVQKLLFSLLPEKVTPASPEQVKEALLRRVYFRRMMHFANGSHDVNIFQLTGDLKALPPSPKTPSGPHTHQATRGGKGSFPSEDSIQEPGESSRDRRIPPEIPEGLALAVRVAALRAEVSGELLNDFVFKQTWEVLKDWLKLKKVGEFQFQAELKNCQAYAFGLMVSLDQAMTEGEICPARIKEALWGNVYGGAIPYGDPALSLLTKYVLRQLTHVMQIADDHFFQAKFSWADFPLSPNFLAPPLLPPLSLPVSYGGYSPERSPSDSLAEPGILRSKLIST
ncbi:uncharacterized protein LOC34618837 [Cyclospora cayetanensis]|nr:uncharacterized protein LOC34618837 [Cyclospora cayetanensis]